MPDFEVLYYRKYRCDEPECPSRPGAEVRLIDDDGNRSNHYQVCGSHIQWAKDELIRQAGGTS